MWKRTLNKEGLLMGTGFIWLRMGPIGSMFEHAEEIEFWLYDNYLWLVKAAALKI
jgi:hypothetical protein